MPIQPNLLEQLLFYTFNLGPAPVLDIWSGIALRVVVAARCPDVRRVDSPLLPGTSIILGSADHNS